MRKNIKDFQAWYKEEKLKHPKKFWIKNLTEKYFTQPFDPKKNSEDKLIRKKVRTVLTKYRKMGVRKYMLMLKHDEIKNYKLFYPSERKWIQKLTWKPYNSEKYKDSFRRIYPEIICVDNNSGFEIEARDIWGNKTTRVIEQNEIEPYKANSSHKFLRHWNVLRTTVSRATHDGYVGRQMRFLIRDRDTKLYLGVICISSDMVDTKQRNKHLGLRNFRFYNDYGLPWNNSYNGSTIVPTYPFSSYFLGGKLLSMLTVSKPIREMWNKMYGDLSVGATTTSLYGSLDDTENKTTQTQYDGLTPYWKNLQNKDNEGRTEGTAPFWLPHNLTKEVEEYVIRKHPYLFWYHNINRIRDSRKRFHQNFYKLLNLTNEGVSNQPRKVFWSNFYEDSNKYLKNNQKIFEDILIKNNFVKKILTGKKQEEFENGKIVGKIDEYNLVKIKKPTDKLREHIKKIYLEELRKKQMPDNEIVLKPKFDDSVEAITEHWRFGYAGDTTKPDIKLVKQFGKDIRTLVKGRVDRHEMFSKALIDKSSYAEMKNLTWKQSQQKFN